jgi:cell division topological specificity factor
MSFLSRFLGRESESDSAAVAKQRLQLVLAQDRLNISPDTLNLLKDEMIAVISHHIEIDQANVQVSMTRTSQGSCLVANIPVIRVRVPEAPERIKRTRTPRAHTRA